MTNGNSDIDDLTTIDQSKQRCL